MHAQHPPVTHHAEAGARRSTATGLALALGLMTAACAGPTATMPTPTPTVTPSISIATHEPPALPDAADGSFGLVAYVDPDGQLTLTTPDGLNTQRVTVGGGRVTALGWAADGRRLAYIHAMAPDAARQLAIYDLDGRAPITLTLQLTDTWVAKTLSHLVWSPNGRHLLLDGGTGEARSLTVVDPETGATQATLSAHGYAWSPDGERLAFGQGHPLPTPLDIGNGDALDLAVVTIGDPSPTRLLEGSRQDLYMPRAWLDDGRLVYDHIVYTGPDDASRTPGSTSGPWWIRPDDDPIEPRPARGLPPDREAVLARLPERFRNPSTGTASWLPDAEALVFDAGSGSQRGIFVFDWRRGGEPLRIADGTLPAWQPRELAIDRPLGRTSERARP